MPIILDKYHSNEVWHYFHVDIAYGPWCYFPAPPLALSLYCSILSFPSEILYGRDAVMKQRRFQRKVAVRTEQREKESIRLPKLKGFEDWQSRILLKLFGIRRFRWSPNCHKNMIEEHHSGLTGCELDMNIKLRNPSFRLLATSLSCVSITNSIPVPSSLQQWLLTLDWLRGY